MLLFSDTPYDAVNKNSLSLRLTSTADRHSFNSIGTSDSTDAVRTSIYLMRFGATVCETVRPMLSDSCLSCLPVLSVLYVTLVCCGQTVEWIKMKLGMQVGLGPGHIVLDEDPALPPLRGRAPPQFSPHMLWPNGWMD